MFRFGVNRTLTPSTHVRLSYGESLRFASIAEKYVVGSLSDGINIRGNLGLKSESGNNWECGVVQEWNGVSGSALFEASAFLLNYDDMIEYTLQAATDSNGSIIIIDGVPQFYFQPLNLGKTRISGFEVSATGDVKVRNLPIRGLVGYVQLC